MKQFELTDPKILGEEHPQYGWTFWDSQVNGDFPVMFNSKQGNILPGTRIQAETAELKTSKNGKEYLRLKKVTFEDEAKPLFEGKSAPSFSKADKPFFRDDTTLALDVWRAIKDQWDIRTVHKDPTEAADLYDAVQFHTENLSYMIQNARSGLQSPSLGNSAIKEPKPPPAAKPWTKAVAANEDEFTKYGPEDMPEDIEE